eukprot:6694426-Pyramimonas_sp.AAC.2
MSACDSSRVAEWKRRKASSASDPVTQLRNTASGTGDRVQPVLCTALVGAPSAPLVEARANGTVVASSHRTQIVNQRYYFPVDDCRIAHFASSAKRWR